MLSPISSRRRLTAWFRLLAIWLLVLMPLASQLAKAAAAHRPAAPICAATQHADRHELPRDALSAFGYCDLLASQPMHRRPPRSPMPCCTRWSAAPCCRHQPCRPASSPRWRRRRVRHPRWPDSVVPFDRARLCARRRGLPGRI
ncbi:MAG: hypothetical protein VB137_13380 [Burkholderia sp.]